MSPSIAQPLDLPLPPGVPTGSWGRPAGYQAFPTFSRTWWLRRGAVFWPIAIAVGAAFATWHAASVGAWGDWPELALRACVAALAIVSVGPLLATVVRYQRLSYAAERILVVAAIMVGLLVTKALIDWVNAYHTLLMATHGGASMASFIPDSMRPLVRLLRLDGTTLVPFIASGGIAAFFYLTERGRLAEHANRHALERLSVQKDAADMRLAVLQAQVEPHFLFNTLASVRSLVRTDPERAVATIDAMADYLRTTLPRLRETGIEEATLQAQLEICLRYLELMNIRMGGRIQVVVDVSDEARALSFPPLILLSLVENAVKHGIEPKSGPGKIVLRGNVGADGSLLVAVEDNGAGLRPGVGGGLGLANVRAHLRSRFGGHASLSISSPPEGGVLAAVLIEASNP